MDEDEVRGSAERPAKPITTFDMKEAVEVSCRYILNKRENATYIF